MIAPVIFKQKNIGLIITGDKTMDGQYEKKDLDFLLIIANEISIALNNFNTIERMKK